MKKKQVKFLKQIVETPSPTGFETAVAEIVRARLQPSADAIETDTMGSVHAVYDGSLHTVAKQIEAEGAKDIHIESLDTSFIRDNLSDVDFVDVESGIDQPASQLPDDVLPEPRTLMLSTHMDEIGLMVSYISDEGFLYVSALGGVDAAILPGMRVDVHAKEGSLRGVVGRKPIHLIGADDRKSVTPLDQLVIDLGLPAKAVKKKVRVGDPITFAVGFELMGSNMAVSRAFDDKVGVFISCRVFEELSESDGYIDTFVSAITTQEEIGTRGAITSAYSLDPDVAIAFDVTHATDYPGIDKSKYGDIRCGKGPVIARGPNINPVVFDALVAAAESEGIPYQLEAEPSVTGTDARAIQVARDGIPTGLVSVPLRYMHTPTEVVDLRDIENTIKLLVRFARDLADVESFVPANPRDFESTARIAAKEYVSDFDSMREELVKMREDLDDILVDREFGADIVAGATFATDSDLHRSGLTVMTDDSEDAMGSDVAFGMDYDLDDDFGGSVPAHAQGYVDGRYPTVNGSYVTGISDSNAGQADMANGYIPRSDMKAQYGAHAAAGFGANGTPEHQGGFGEASSQGARSVDELRVADFRDELVNNGYPDDWKLVGIESPFKRQQDEITAEFRGMGMSAFPDDDSEGPYDDELAGEAAMPGSPEPQGDQGISNPSVAEAAAQGPEAVDGASADAGSDGDDGEGASSAPTISDSSRGSVQEVEDPFADEGADLPTIEIDIDEGDDSYYDYI